MFHLKVAAGTFDNHAGAAYIYSMTDKYILDFGLLRRSILLEPILTIAMGLFLLVSGCSENSSGPVNTPPIIESIEWNPAAVHPGSDVVLKVIANDPDGDSVRFRWTTYPKAGLFSDTLSDLCTLTVTPVLEGGMFLKVTLYASDSLNYNDTSIWIPLIEGETVSGHTYYANTEIPLPGVVVTIGKLIDTSSFRGAYEIKHISPGLRTITMVKDGCGDHTADLTVDSHMVYDIYADCPGLTRTVSGRITSFDDFGLQNVQLTVLNDDRTPTILSGVSDNMGNFTIEGVPPGKRTLTLEDLGNPVYHILSDTILITIVNDTNLQLRGRVKQDLFVSEGIDHPENWILQDIDYWKRWLVDSAGQCFLYNSCEVHGYGLLTMANPVSVPADAEAVTLAIDADLEDASLVIGYIVDGKSVFTQDVAMGTGEYNIVETVDISKVNPLGHELAIELYGLYNHSDVCASICLRRFELAFYK